MLLWSVTLSQTFIVFDDLDRLEELGTDILWNVLLLVFV